MRISDWSSDVCSSDLIRILARGLRVHPESKCGRIVDRVSLDGQDHVADAQARARQGAAGVDLAEQHAARAVELQRSGDVVSHRLAGAAEPGTDGMSADRTSGVSGKGVSVRVVRGGSR